MEKKILCIYSYVVSISSHVRVSKSRRWTSFNSFPFLSSPPKITTFNPTRDAECPPRATCSMHRKLDPSFLKLERTRIHNYCIYIKLSTKMNLHIHSSTLKNILCYSNECFSSLSIHVWSRLKSEWSKEKNHIQLTFPLKDQIDVLPFIQKKTTETLLNELLCSLSLTGIFPDVSNKPYWCVSKSINVTARENVDLR